MHIINIRRSTERRAGPLIFIPGLKRLLIEPASEKTYLPSDEALWALPFHLKDLVFQPIFPDALASDGVCLNTLFL